MDLTKRYEGLPLWSPLSMAGLEAVVEELPASGARALDLGCGAATALAHMLDAGRAGQGIAVDSDARALARAAKVLAKRGGRAPRALRLMQADARILPFDVDVFGVVCSIGGPALMPTPQSSLGKLAALVPIGGWLLHGEVVWQRPPKPEYLEALGDLPAGSICSALARTRLLDEAGLDIVSGRDSTIEEWDAFEDRILENVVALAEKYPDDEKLAGRLAAMRRWNAAQAKWGRGSMAFSLQLWRREAPPPR